MGKIFRSTLADLLLRVDPAGYIKTFAGM